MKIAFLTILVVILISCCEKTHTKIEFYALPRNICVLTSATRTLENYNFKKDTTYRDASEKYYFCKTQKKKLIFYMYGYKKTILDEKFIFNNLYKLKTDTMFYGPKLCFIFNSKKEADTLYINSMKKVYYKKYIYRMNDTLFNYLINFLPIELKENWEEEDLHVNFCALGNDNGE